MANKRRPRLCTSTNVDFEYRYILVKVVSVEKKVNRYKVGYRLSEDSYYYDHPMKDGRMASKAVWCTYSTLPIAVGTEFKHPMLIDVD